MAPNRSDNIGMGIAIGMAIGVGIGVALDNIALGIDHGGCDRLILGPAQG